MPYSLRAILSAAGLVLSSLIVGLFQLLPGRQRAPFSALTHDSSGLVLALVALALAAVAVWVAPGSIARRGIATGILLAYPLAYGSADIAMMKGASNALTPLFSVAVVASLSIPWLIASEASRRAWASLVILVLEIPWVFAVAGISAGVYSSIATVDGATVPERTEPGFDAADVTVVLLAVTLPLAAVLIAALVLDGPARTARAAAWARSRPATLPGTAASPGPSPTSPSPTEPSTTTPAHMLGFRIAAIVALLVGMGLVYGGVAVWRSSPYFDQTVPQSIALWVAGFIVFGLAVLLERRGRSSRRPSSAAPPQ
jgi:hypothetical protein